MATIKKKDLKKYKPSKNKKEDLDELINADGSPIEGDRNPVNNSEIETAPQQTSADFAQSAIQPRRWYNSYYGTPYSHGHRGYTESVDLDEVARQKMEKMVEDMFSQKTDSHDMVKKIHDTDVNRNKIPDMQEISVENQSATRITQDFVTKLNKVPLNGDEVGMILNYVIENMDLTKVPNDYKGIIKNKI